MPTRLFRPALLLSSIFLACNAGSVVTSSTSTSPSTPDPSGEAEAGSDAGTAPVTPDGGAIADGQVPGKDVDPGTPHVQLIGRFDLSDSAGATCAWPGCRIVARFDGTAVSVTMNEIDEGWMEGAPSEWELSIDGQVKQRLVMTPGQSSYPLASGLAPGEHTVELYKLSESQNGMTQFRGFDFTGGTLLPPPPRKTRHIEVIGDSAAAGFGIEGVGQPNPSDCPDADWSAHWQNFKKSFGQVLADAMDAELHGTVYSGKGIAQNIWPTDKETLPVLFDRTLPVYAKSTWDFSTWTPDLVVIMAGGNDFAIGQPVDQGPATLEQFTSAYSGFVGKIRQHYPQAHVLLTVSPSTEDDQPPGRFTRTNILAGVQAVTTEKNGAGDAKVSWFAPTVGPKSELVACMGHGTPAWHQRVAGEIAAFVKPKIGW